MPFAAQFARSLLCVCIVDVKSLCEEIKYLSMNEESGNIRTVKQNESKTGYNRVVNFSFSSD